MRERINVAILAAEVNATTSNVDIYLCNPYVALRRQEARDKLFPIKKRMALCITVFANQIVTFQELLFQGADASFELHDFHVFSSTSKVF